MVADGREDRPKHLQGAQYLIGYLAVLLDGTEVPHAEVGLFAEYAFRDGQQADVV